MEVDIGGDDWLSSTVNSAAIDVSVIAASFGSDFHANWLAEVGNAKMKCDRVTCLVAYRISLPKDIRTSRYVNQHPGVK
jgi:hypothetical protein